MLTNEYIYQRAYEIFDMIMDKADNRPQTYDEIILTLATVSSLIENKIIELSHERMEWHERTFVSPGPPIVKKFTTKKHKKT